MAAAANLTPRLSSHSLIAPAWHTIVFIAIFVGLSVVGGFFQHAVKQHPQPAAPSGNAVPRYISALLFEWLLVLYVRMGVHKGGGRLRDLVGGQWATPKDVVKGYRSGRRVVGRVDRFAESSSPGRRNECRARTASPRNS